MNRKMLVGSQVDIDASFDGGPVDTSVTYSVPESQQSIITVDAAGVVTALAEGTGIVVIRDTLTQTIQRYIVFNVLSSVDFAAQQDRVEDPSRLTLNITPIQNGGGSGSGSGSGSGYTPPTGAVLIVPQLTSNNSNGYTAWAKSSQPGSAFYSVAQSSGEAWHAFDLLVLSAYGATSKGIGGFNSEDTLVDGFDIGLVFPQPVDLSAVKIQTAGHGVVQFTVLGASMYDPFSAEPNEQGLLETLGQSARINYGSAPGQTSLQSVLIPLLGVNGEYPGFSPRRKIIVRVGMYGLGEQDNPSSVSITNIRMWGNLPSAQL